MNPCPTCGLRMYGIGYCGGDIVLRCLRCGTTKTGDAGPSVPDLIERLRRFAKLFKTTDVELSEKWKSFGIAEAIQLPEQP